MPTHGSPGRIILLVVATLWGAGEAAAQAAAPLERGRVYTAGERIASPWVGLSFVVPPGQEAGYEPDLGGVLMRSSEMMIAVFGAFAIGPEELGGAAIAFLAEEGVQLAAQELDQPDPRTVRGTYAALTPEGTGVTVAVVRGGPEEQSVGIFTLGAPGTEPALREAADAILGSIEWSTPAAAAWRESVAGLAFTTSGTSSTYSPGGAGGYGSHASGTEAALELCSDGGYAYESRTESYISIEGASAERVSSDAHAGRWRLTADLAGTPYLLLEATDGRSFSWLVEETAEGAVIDGTAYAASPGRRCR